MLRSSLARHRSPLLLALLVVLLELGGEPVRQFLAYSRSGIEHGQLWRLFSGSLVHLGPYHCLLNLLGLGALVALCPQPQPAREWLARVLVLSLGMSALLYWRLPSLEHYVGLSGVIHGLFLLGLVPMVRQRDLIATGCLLYLLGKLGYELWAGAAVSDEAAIGGRVVTESHLFGTLAALVYGLLAGTFRSTGEPRTS